MIFDIHLHGPGANRVAGELETSLRDAWGRTGTGNPFKVPILIKQGGTTVQKEIEVKITVIEGV